MMMRAKGVRKGGGMIMKQTHAMQAGMRHTLINIHSKVKKQSTIFDCTIPKKFHALHKHTVIYSCD
jgi:hypothetical protein